MYVKYRKSDHHFVLRIEEWKISDILTINLFAFFHITYICIKIPMNKTI